MGWLFGWRVHVWQLLWSSGLHKACVPMTAVGRGALQIFSNWGACREFCSPDREWNVLLWNKQAQSKQNDSCPHLHLQMLSCCCPSREDFSFAGNCIDWLWLGKKSDRTHSKCGAAQRELQLFFTWRRFNLLLEKVFLGPRVAFPWCKAEGSCARRAVGRFWLPYLSCQMSSVGTI